ncbi:DUF1344 domain-containing protein [Pseudaminobacter arsenicus]|uniref:DUF1344 domain-containing protein n=1 Tax=Borborobacter arsenicus TaxID=1851146 RepID=A0A432V153_9HYPH|nr:DUF1344 domain-containing protein [Pseudaminobacter arsenicus]RUM95900.1 DUF1344 domain-containing protein [Pseudaminobacter arsenicus]
MRTLLIPAAIAALFATSAVALAAQHTTGTIKTFDAKAMSVKLADGSVYMLPKTVKHPALKAGEKVDISWDNSGKNRMIESVTIVK